MCSLTVLRMRSSWMGVATAARRLRSSQLTSSNYIKCHLTMRAYLTYLLLDAETVMSGTLIT